MCGVQWDIEKMGYNGTMFLQDREIIQYATLRHGEHQQCSLVWYNVVLFLKIEYHLVEYFFHQFWFWYCVEVEKGFPVFMMYMGAKMYGLGFVYHSFWIYLQIKAFQAVL